MSGYLTPKSFFITLALAVCLYSISNHLFGETVVKPVPRRRGTQVARPEVVEERPFSFQKAVQDRVPIVDTKTEVLMAAKWVQKTVVLPAKSRGCHLVTDQVKRMLTRIIVSYLMSSLISA